MQTIQPTEAQEVPIYRPVPEEMIPPAELSICFGGGDFLGIGRRLVRRLQDLAGLLPSERVLDIGCGIGRAAVPLTEYLTAHGVYEGFDTYPFGITWASENITPHFPNFRFKFVNVFNSLYNPTAPVTAKDFIFPYSDASFDVALLNSVFTHMLPEDVMSYLEQIDRVLDRGGRIYCTWFLMNDEAREQLAAHPDTAIRLKHGYGSFYMDNPQDPEEAVGYEEQFVRALLHQRGFTIEAVKYGNWCGRSSSFYQDCIVVRKGS